MAKKDKAEIEQPATERESAPDTVTAVQQPVYTPPPPLAPRQMRVERQGSQSVPYVRRFPQIRGGQCEFCGTLDPNVEAIYQYKLCPHYRGMDARCTYCPETSNPDEVVYHADLNVAEHPDYPGTLIMWCNSFKCSEAHMKRWKRST